MKTVSERLRRNANMCARVNAAVVLLCETALVGANEIERLEKQRDELLASLKEARELVEDWGAYAPAYMQEKHDLEGDLSRLDAVISKMETP